MNVIRAVCFPNTTFRYKLSGFSIFTSRGIHYGRLWLSLRLKLQSYLFRLQRNLRRCQTHLSAPCSNLHRSWKEKEQKIFQHILVHALLATAPTSLSTWSWFVRLPLSGLPVFATCLHQSLAITWHCLSCSSLGNKCTVFMFFWAKTQLERNESVTSSFKPSMLSLTELSVCDFTSFFWTGKFPRECVSVWVLFGINLFCREHSEEDVL